MKFEEAMDYLRNLTKFGMNFGLGRISELMRRLGNPQDKLQIVHIGGTNGKGSTGAMIAAALAAGGYRVGTFTSPHLHSYTERYRINGEEITGGDIANLIERLRPHLETMVKEGFEHPTEFEVSTALAFCYFLEQQVDLLALEVGLGGAIDSTNVINKPLVSVITNVAMDHMDYLGQTVTEIARVKVGIIKDRVPVVTASQNPAVLKVIRKACEQHKSPLVSVGQDVTWESVGDISLQGQRLNIKGRRAFHGNILIPLLGRHQLENTATAIAVLEILGDAGYQISGEAIRQGLMLTRWPARMEIVREKPMVLIDAAHNYEGAKSLRQALDDYFPTRQVVLVMGMLGDKERGRVVAELAPRARMAVITKPNSPRAGDWQQLAEEIRPLVSEVRVVEEIKAAVTQGIEDAGSGDLVCITGSFYMVAEAREYLVSELKW
ncbi:MAG: bifunctional folylpolyglutamate synthase/dihydrofolate synthase [Firmicutes bacterium]|nr:bifunctional folylpolyglutamate synthase/dihydrofolate synthase [Bacillota bacterium]